MPQRRKPNAIRELEGTERLGRFEEVEMSEAVDLKPPPGLIDNVHARRLWKAYSTELYNCGVLAEVNKNPLAILCNTEALLIDQYQSGEPPNAALQTQWRLLLTEFGLTPTTRSKPVPVRQKDADPNERFFGVS